MIIVGQYSTLFGATTEQSDHVGMRAKLLHNLHFAQQLLFLLWCSAIFDRLDGYEQSTLTPANVLSFGFPNLAKIAFADERL